MSTSSQRIVAATAATIEWQAVDQDGEPAAPAGTVTVGVARSDGSSVVPAGAATTLVGTKSTRALTLADTTALDVLTATWSIGADVVGVTTHEVVGGVYATVAEIRGIEDSLADLSDPDDATIKRCRAEVEAMIESQRACGQAFVPRFSVIAVADDGRIRVPNLRTVRWTRTVTGNTPGPGREVDVYAQWLSSYATWDSPWGAAGSYVLAGVEHGLDRPPADLKRAAIQAIRRQVNLRKSGVDSRAMSYQGPSGEVQRFPTPGLGPWITGIPDVDEVIQRYTVAEAPGVIRITPTAGYGTTCA